jgi:hypothetical protein
VISTDLIYAATRRRCLCVAFSLGATVLTALSGCGGDTDGAKAVPAGGLVKYKGKPLEQGTIQFVPEIGRAAHGTIQDGKFTLTTHKEGDGAIPGKHKVGIVSTKETPSKKKGAEPETVFVVPKSYGQPGGSNISVDIPDGGKTDIEINIQ